MPTNIDQTELDSVDDTTMTLLDLADKLEKKLDDAEQKKREPIAIIGFDCRFPGGANDPRKYWDLLNNGVDAIEDLTKKRWLSEENTYIEALLGFHPGTRWAGLIDGIDKFDPAFFDISPREAASLDPQQRLILSVTWHALEHAGIIPTSLVDSSTGVYMGITSMDHQQRVTSGDFRHTDAYSVSGNTHCFAAGRLSYFLGTQGPCMSVDTACSSSLVTIDLACKSLRLGESNLCIAGGVNAILSPLTMSLMSKTQALSPDGRCKTFDSRANGYVRGEGCGVVILKRLSDAQKDGDKIWGLVRGTAVNQDGRSAALTAPNISAQKRVINSALDNANIQASDISYIEAHGTGTPLGDPIEIEAIRDVYGKGSNDEPCYVGSVKTNIGHLEAAAGVAGVIKILLSFEHSYIPKSLHLQNLNPRISVDQSRLAFMKEEVSWARDQEKVAAISSFGISGTNSHLVLSSYESVKKEAVVVNSRFNTDETKVPQALVVSAKSTNSLKRTLEKISLFLDQNTIDDYSEFCTSFNELRSRFTENVVFVEPNVEGLRGAIKQYLTETALSTAKTITSPNDERDIVFMFTGQGAQYTGMAKELYNTYPSFRANIECCEKALLNVIDIELTKVIFDDAYSDQLNKTQYTQPALFAIEYSLAKLWMDCGITPSYFIGHSVGEYVAACLSGVFSLEDAIQLVAKRGALMQSLPLNGAMVTVWSDKDLSLTVKEFPCLAVAAYNSPESQVVSGLETSVEAFSKKMAEMGVKTKPLQVSHAFHSPLMDPILERFEKELNNIQLGKAKVPIISNLTGNVDDDDLLSKANYWVEHLRQPVRFSDGIASLKNLGNFDYLEIGPRPVLTNLAMAQVPIGNCNPSINPKNDDSLVSLIRSFGHMSALGHNFNWSKITGREASSHCSLPNYGFDEQSFLVDFIPPVARNNSKHKLLGEYLKIPGDTDVHTWTGLLAKTEMEYLVDHKIENTVVFPGPAYTEMAVSAIGQIFLRKTLAFEDVVFRQALIIPEDSYVQTQAKVEISRDGKHHFDVHSRTNVDGDFSDNDPWAQNVTGTVSVLSDREISDERIDAESMVSSFDTTMSGKEFYDIWTKRGNQWGYHHQGIENIWYNETVGIAKIVVPNDLIEKLKNYFVHPSVLDACVQVLAVMVPDEVGGAFVGRSAEVFKTYRPMTDSEYWTRVSLTDIDVENRRIKGDVYIYNCDGLIIGEMLGLSFEFIDQSASKKVVNVSAYHTAWVTVADDTTIEQKDDAAVESQDDSAPSHNILIVERNCTHVDTVRSQLAHSGSSVAKTNFNDLSTFCENNDIASFDKIVLLFSGRDSNSCYENLVDQQKLLIADVFELKTTFQILVDHFNTDTAPKIWLVVDELKPPSSSIELSPANMPFLALSRTLSAEYAHCWGGIYFVGTDEVSWTKLSQLLPLQQSEDQLLLLNDEVYVPRLHNLPRADNNIAPSFAKDRSYIVTGGMGGIGLELAKWMADSGARRLILMGRSSLPDRNEWPTYTGDTLIQTRIEKIRNIESLGVQVFIASVDITDADALNTWVDRYNLEGWPAIGGVLHTAGISDLQAFDSLENDRLTAVLSAKVTGTVNLHQALSSEELEFFVMFSSISTVFGSPGLTSYALANSFLDGFSAYRRSLGYAALSVSWGPWSEVGMMTTTDNDESKNSIRLMGGISNEQGLGILSEIWGSREPHVVAVATDWSLWAAQYPLGFNQCLLIDIAAQHNAKSATLGFEWGVYSSISDRDKTDYLCDWVAKVVMLVLMLSDDNIDTSVPITALGIDSLIALELKTNIEKDLRINLPIVELVKGPSISELAGVLENIMNTSDSSADTIEVISTDDDGSAYPISYGQRSLWFLNKFSPTSYAYNVGYCVRLISSIDEGTLKQALEYIVLRHSALNLRFDHAGEDTASQHTGKDTLDVMKAVNASHFDSDSLSQLVRTEYQKPFQLSEDAPFRAVLYHLGENDHILLLSIHHIVCDGFSLWIILDELWKAYDMLAQGGEPTLPVIGYSYRDFVVWQNKYLSSEKAETSSEYWKNIINSSELFLNLPTDYSRPLKQTNNGKSYGITLDGVLTDKLRNFSKGANLTLFHTLLSGFGVMLSRYANQRQFMIGVPSAGRSQQEFMNVVGHFMNTLPIAMSILDDATMEQLASTVKSQMLDAMSHEDFPFSLMVEQMKSQRNASYSPIYQVMFSLQKAHKDGGVMDLLTDKGEERRITLGGVDMQAYNIAQQEGQFDLTLEMAESDETILGVIKYNTDLFMEETIASMADSYIYLLERLMDQKDAPIKRFSSVDYLSERCSASVLDGPVYDNDITHHILEKFHHQVKTQPNNIAVTDEHSNLSYQELSNKADILASLLNENGVSPGDHVAICMHRDVEFVLAIIACWKLGCAYVPVDPEYPKERIHYIVENSESKCVITNGQTTQIVSDIENVISYKIVQSLLIGENKSNLNVTLDAENTAYVIYTSGSTGRPKGVVVNHGSLGNLYDSLNQVVYSELKKPGALSIALNASFSFDASVKQLMMIAGGHNIVITPDQIKTAPDKLISWVAEHNIDVFDSTPTLLGLLADNGFFDKASEIPTLLIGGEALTEELHRRMLDAGVNAFNVYGPTECTVDAVVCSITEMNSFRTIGLPLPNTSVIVVDGNQLPVRKGLVGEICIAGKGVSQGYLGNIELTQTKFVSVPENVCRYDGVMYRTGDFGRVNHSGQIDYFGRSDDQVKVRGYRIELDEIVSVLMEHTNIDRAVVSVAKDSTGSNVLVAYTVVHDVGQFNQQELRAWLKNRVPAHLIPGQFIRIDKIPMTINGKTDLHRLKSMKVADSDRVSIAPTNEQQTKLKEIWALTLGIDDFGITDSFFELGGHSIMSIGLLSKVRDHWNIDISLAMFFQFDTIQQMSDLINDGVGKNAITVQLNKAQSDNALYCIHPIGGGVHSYRAIADKLERLKVLGLQAVNLIHDTPIDTIDGMAKIYVAEILANTPAGSIKLLGWSMGGVLALEVCRQLIECGREVDKLVIIDSRAPISDTKTQQYSQAGSIQLFVDDLYRLADTSPFIVDKNLPQEGALESALCQAVSDGLLPSDASLNILKNQYYVFDTHILALDRFVVKSPITTNIDFVCPPREDVCSSYGWKALTTGQFKKYTMGTSHYDILSDNSVAIAGIIDE